MWQGPVDDRSPTPFGNVNKTLTPGCAEKYFIDPCLFHEIRAVCDVVVVASQCRCARKQVTGTRFQIFDRFGSCRATTNPQAMRSRRGRCSQIFSATRKTQRWLGAAKIGRSGAVLLVYGSAVAFKYAQSAALGPAATAELASGISAAFLAGAAGIVLGILALLGIHADILTRRAGSRRAAPPIRLELACATGVDES